MELMSSKLDLLKKQIAELLAQLEVEMAKNANGSDGILPNDTGKKNIIVERSASKVVKHWGN